MINYDNVISELNIISDGWDYEFEMTVERAIGEDEDLWHSIYLVDTDEVKLEIFHEVMTDVKCEKDVIKSCFNGIKGHMSFINEFYEKMMENNKMRM